LKAFNAVLAECIDMMARALRAGTLHSRRHRDAVAKCAGDRRECFQGDFQATKSWMPLRDTLLELLDSFKSQDLQVLVTAILVQKDTGGNLAEILDRTAFVIRERLRIRGEIRVQTSQGRLTEWILSALPLVMLLLINMVSPGYSKILLHDPLGRKLIYASGGMLLARAFLIRRIVNGIEV
jgi:tight adherence protein B